MIRIHMNIFREFPEQVIDTLSRLINIGYVSISVRFDGTFNNTIAIYCVKNKINLSFGENIKQLIGGGYITQKYLWDFYYHSHEEYLLKIDPDTIPLNKLPELPSNAISTNLSHKKKCVFGGCIVFPRSIVYKIIHSGLLVSETYKERQWTYYHTRLKKRIASQDMIIYDVSNKLGIELFDTKDYVSCKNYKPYIDVKGIKNGKYKFCHPKNLWYRITENG